MPSGAKKRKAAKKRKEKEATSTTAHSRGVDDPKTRDGGESDDGESSSPISQEHGSHKNPFSNGEGNGVEKRESVEGVENDRVSAQRVGIEEEGIVQIENNSKSEDGSEKKNNAFGFVESAKESSDTKGSSEDSGSSSGSSSDSSSSSDDESNAVETKIMVVEAGDSKEESYDLISESTTFVDLVKPVDSLSQVETPSNSVARTDHDKVSATEENGVKKVLLETENSEISSVLTVDSPQKKDEVVTTSEKNEDKLLLSYNPPRSDTSNGAEPVKDSKAPESCDSPPLVPSAAPPVQTTSWKSCCGLFDVLTGSNR